MDDPTKLSDNQIDDRLYAAIEKLGEEPGETVRGNAAIEAARKALTGLRLNLVWAMEHDTDDVPGTGTKPVPPPWMPGKS